MSVLRRKAVKFANLGLKQSIFFKQVLQETA